MNRLITREAHQRAQIKAGPRRPLENDLSAPPNIFVRILFVCFFVFDIPAFTLQLAQDPSTGRFTGSPVFAFMTLAGNLFTAIIILSSRDARALVKNSWPVWAMLGLGLVSALWSSYPKGTIDVTVRNAGAFFLGLAIVGRMPHFQGVRFVIRTMVLACALSVAWVFLFPQVAVHQATDVYQFVHAGLWRGIFSHKQGLGLFAGMTTGLLLFYRTLVFPPIVLVGAIGCSLSCLIGTQSSTGFVTAVMVFLIFYSARVVVNSPPRARRGKLAILTAVFLILGGAFNFGLLNPVITHIIGKSSDLTGRADFWPIEIANFKSSGRMWLGGGLGTNFAADLYEQSVDNGYLDMLFAFGYLLAPILYFIFAIILWKSCMLLLNSRENVAATSVFPFGIWMVILIDNITESNFMSKSFSTILTVMAIALLFEERNQAPSRG